MKNYDIPFDKEACVAAIEKITGYTAKNTVDGFDRVVVTGDETNVIDELFSQSLEGLVSKLKDYTPQLGVEKVTIINSNDFNDTVIPTITDSLNNLLINDTSARWFFVAREAPDSERYNQQASMNFVDIQNLLLRKRRPIQNEEFDY